MFGKILNELRKNNKYSMDEVVELYNKKFGGKLNKSTLSRYENGLQEPMYTVVVNLADLFGVSVDYLSGKTINTDHDEEQSFEVLPTKNVHMIPLFESVSAGFGAYADSTILEYIPLYFQSNDEATESICIKVTGNSMAPRIEDGDIIQVRKQTSVDSGSIAVVLIGGEEGYVKKVNYGDDWIELISLNENYPPMRFEGEDVTKIQVVGLVKKIIKDA